MLGWVIQYVLWQPPRAAAFVLNRLSLGSMRAGEFESDALAVACAGNEAVERLLRTTIYERTVLWNIGSALESGQPDPLSAGRRRLAELPAERSAAIFRAAAENEPCVDDTHPPTVERLEAVRNLPWVTARVALGHDQATAIDREREPGRRAIEQRLTERLPLV